MMKKILNYSVLRYSPLRIAGEYINLGIIFDAGKDEYREFRYSKKISRVTNFDDELDAEVIKQLLRRIKEDVEGNLLTTNYFDINEYTKFFVNAFCFEKPRQISYEDLGETVESLYKLYFRFEFEKEERPTREDDQKIVARIFNESGIKTARNQAVCGAFNDQITYDIVTDDYKIKLFDFDDKDLKRLINSARSWAWIADHDAEDNVMIMYRYSNDGARGHNDEFSVILNILNASKATVMTVENGISSIQKLQ